MFGLTTFVPPLVQGVHLGTPVEAGAAVAAMSIGWPIGSVIGGRLMLRYGSRNLVIGGTALHIVGTALLTQAINLVLVGFALFLMVKAYNSMRRKPEAAPDAPAAEVVTELSLLIEIRDALKAKG